MCAATPLLLLLSWLPQSPHLAVRTESGYAWLDELPAGISTAIVCATSRSERLPCARATPRGTGLAVANPSDRPLELQLRALRLVEHAAGTRVVRTPEGLRLCGPPLLPRELLDAAGGDRLAELARIDANVVRDAVLSVGPPPDGDPRALVLVAEEGRGAVVRVAADADASPAREARTLELPAGPRAVLALPAHACQLEVGAAGLDQLVYATLEELPPAREVVLQSARARPLRRLGARPWRGEGPPRQAIETTDDVGAALELDAGLPLELALAPDTLLELGFRPPPGAATQGRTWTLLVELERAGGGGPAAAAAAPAPPAVGGGLRDAAGELGVAFVHLEGPDEQLDIRPTMGPGAAWGDVDGDGWVDLYLVQGGGRAGSRAPRNRLLRNVGGTRFEDAGASAGADDPGAGMGALLADLDGDLDLDLYLANYGPDALYLNDGAGRFTEVGARAGLGLDLWSAGVAAADFDRDGDLDLYVTSYLRYDLDALPPHGALPGYRREDPVEMLPFAFPGERNVFLRNDGPGDDGIPRLVDATEALGLLDEQGRGMQPVFWDFDRDGDDDLYVANDVSFNVLFRNEGDGRFRDISFETGMDDPRGGMGVSIGDVEGDGDEDLFLSNWQLEANALYLNNDVNSSPRHRVGTFEDGTVPAGLGPDSIGVTSWGAVFFDADLDGDLDLFVANGYTSPDYRTTGICVGQPDHLYLNDGDGHFARAEELGGPALRAPLASRAVAPCDFDQDGDVDLLVTANNGRARLLVNEIPRRGRWLGVRLRSARGNRLGVGAQVTVRAGERELVRTLQAGASYLAGNPPELHFGLGDAAVDELRVRWPSGALSVHEVGQVDRFVTLVEP